MGFFKKHFSGIKGKLAWIAIATVVAISIEGWVAVSTVHFQSAQMKLMTHEQADRLLVLTSADSQGNEAMRYAWAAIGETDVKRKEESVVKSKKALEEMLDKFKELEKSNPVAYAKVGASKDQWTTISQNLEKSFEFIKQGKSELASENMTKNVSEQAVAASQILETYQKQWEEEFYSTESISQKEVANKEAILYLIIGLGLVLNLTVVLYLGYILTKQLKSISDRVMQSGSQVLSASSQLTTSSQGLSSGATESASSLQETVSSLEEISSTVKMNSDNAREAAALSFSANKAAEEGEQEITKLIRAMDDIASSSKKIEEIITVIDDIAFQTNLLALNAAVEAARAGEQGKGFAVVADAVRTLAQRSASAAKDISNLIQDSVVKSNQGSQVASDSGVVLKNIVNSIKKVSDLNNEISEAGQEQSRGIAQISKAMNELDEATQRNAASAEEVAASSEELSSQSKLMHTMVEDLEKIVTGMNIEEKAEAQLKAQVKIEKKLHEQKQKNEKKGSFLEFKKSKKVDQPTPAVELKKEEPKKANIKIVHSEPVKTASAQVKPVATAFKKVSQNAAELIPFDDDDVEPMKKVGTTDGF
jgi:methyl-accepting chemotaxis protein